MKILKIKIKNIHSLKGEHVVDFTSGPLYESGLFAITGPTGAGKSTILDAITLALFNRIPRFNEKVTKTEIEKIGSVITHYTNGAYAEVEYESGANKYRSKWEISKTRNGTFKDYTMELSTLPDGQLMDLKKSEIPDANERIIGLKYEQFVRSILLSQGEFARFLKSDEKERAQLLEHITGTQIYREIGKATFLKAKEWKETILLLNQQLAAIPSCSPEQITDLIAKIAQIKIEGSQLSERIDHQNIILQDAQKKYELQSKLAQSQKEFQSILIKKQNFEPTKTKLQKYYALDSFRNVLVLVRSEKLRFHDLQLQLKATQEKINTYLGDQNNAISGMALLTKEEVDSQNFMSVMKTFESEIVSLNNELAQLEKSGQSIRQRFNQVLAQNRIKSLEGIEKIKNPKELKEIIVSELSTLAEIKKSIDIPEDQIMNKMTWYRDESIKLNKLTNDLIKYQKANLVIPKLKLEISNANREMVKLDDLLLESLNQISALEKEIQETQIKKEAQIQYLSLDDHRKNLTDNEPCPLCGALHHPYSQTNELASLGNLELIIQDLSVRRQTSNKELNAQNKLMSETKAKTTSLESTLNQHMEMVDQIHQDWPEDLLALSSENLTSKINTINQAYQNLAKYQESLKQVIVLEDLVVLIDDLKDALSQYSVIKSKKDLLYQGMDIVADCNKLQNKFSAATDLVKEYQVAEKLHLGSIASLQKSITTHTENTLPSLQKLGYINIEETYPDLLHESELALFEKQANEMHIAEIEVTQAIKLTEASLSLFTQHSDINMDELRSNISNMNIQKEKAFQLLGGLENEFKTDEERKKSIHAIQLDIHQKEKESYIWLNLELLIGDATGNKYAKFAQNLSLQHLIELTNKRLSELSDRYSLIPSNIEEDLRVQDWYQGGVSRSVKTLSGGESFLVSLALALSLSDMASANVKLESLFIDEGFGTLDAETLEIALATLEKLQSESNRTIGIISHVESLKERIITQIQVEKDNLGYSKIKVVGY